MRFSSPLFSSILSCRMSPGNQEVYISNKNEKYPVNFLLEYPDCKTLAKSFSDKQK